MFGLIGIVLTFAMVFGGYALAGGHLDVIRMRAYEMMIIGGAAVGSTAVERGRAEGDGAGLSCLQGARWSEADQRTCCPALPVMRLARSSVELEEISAAGESANLPGLPN